MRRLIIKVKKKHEVRNLEYKLMAKWTNKKTNKLSKNHCL